MELFFFIFPSVSHAEGTDDAITIKAEEIAAMNAVKMPDVLNHIPGVTAGDSSVSIHGSTKVKVFVDGRPINDVTSSHGGVNWDIVSPDDVEKVVVLRGKGGIAYGMDSSGGVILITTRRISNLKGHLKAYAGNNETFFTHNDIAVTSGIMGIGVTGGYEKTGGYTINNDKERKRIGTKLNFTAEENRNLSFYGDYLEDDRGLSGLPDYPTPFARKTTKTTVLSVQGGYNKISAACNFSHGENNNSDISKNLDQALRVTELGQDIRSSVATGSFGELAFGGGYKLGKAEGTTFDDQREETSSIFLSQNLGLKEYPFSLSLGIRSNSNSVFNESINPEAKASYKKEAWRLTGSCSRTNNTPSFYQRYSQTSSTNPNPGLDMETADNFSVAVFVQPFSFLSGSVTLFHNILDDRITYITGDDGMGQYQNFGEVTYTGFDVAMDVKPRHDVTIKGSYTYMEAKDEETDLYIPAKAKNTGTIEVYVTPVDRLSISFKTKAVSEVYRNKANTKTVPAYSTTDISCEYSFGDFSLFTETENVFDKTYYYSDGLLGPGLTWKIGGELQI